MKGALHGVCGAQKIEQSLFFHAEKGWLLRDFKFQAGHRYSLRVGCESHPGVVNLKFVAFL
jgi:hypothetical protein